VEAGNGGGKSIAAYILPAALSAGLFFLAIAAPPLAMFAPAPLYYVFAAHGYKAGVIVSALLMALVAAAGGASVAAVYAGSCVVMSISLAWSRFNGDSLEKTLAKAVLLPFAASFLVVFGASGFSASGVAGSFSKLSAVSVDSVLESYRQMNVDQEATAWLSENAAELKSLFARILPSMTFLSAMTMATMNLLAIRAASLRFGLGVAFANHSLAAFRAPDWMVWGVVAGGAGSMFAEGFAHTIGMNLLICLSGIYLLQGFALTHFFFMKANVHVILRAIGYFVIFSQPPLMLLMSGLGLADVWVEFRTRKTEKPEE